MTIREAVKSDIDALPDEALKTVRDFVLFQKYRAILESDDTAYLNGIFVDHVSATWLRVQAEATHKTPC
jgi:hypothetical protein